MDRESQAVFSRSDLVCRVVLRVWRIGVRVDS